MAAWVHRLDVPELAQVLPGHATRREHALAEVEEAFAGLDGSIVDEARGWALEHLPPDEPSRLVHGDLLGQNLLVMPDEPTGLIDWEYARRGDPAWDLAIVTRGVKRPFGVADGLARLLRVYRDTGGVSIERDHVRVHELSLAARRYHRALEGEGHEPPQVALDRLRSVVRVALS